MRNKFLQIVVYPSSRSSCVHRTMRMRAHNPQCATRSRLNGIGKFSANACKRSIPSAQSQTFLPPEHSATAVTHWQTHECIQCVFFSLQVIRCVSCISLSSHRSVKLMVQLLEQENMHACCPESPDRIWAFVRVQWGHCNARLLDIGRGIINRLWNTCLLCMRVCIFALGNTLYWYTRNYMLYALCAVCICRGRTHDFVRSFYTPFITCERHVCASCRWEAGSICSSIVAVLTATCECSTEQQQYFVIGQRAVVRKQPVRLWLLLCRLGWFVGIHVRQGVPARNRWWGARVRCCWLANWTRGCWASRKVSRAFPSYNCGR